MENPLLNIGLEHYVIILMCIALIGQVKDVLSSWIRLLVMTVFVSSWLAIVVQIWFKIKEIINLKEIMIRVAFHNINHLIYKIKLDPEIMFNIIHILLVTGLAIFASRIAFDSIFKKREKSYKKIMNNE